MTKLLVVATGNPGKLNEMQAYLGGIDVKLQLKPDNLDVEETGNTFLENACLKASEVAKATGEWAIADDSGLAVDALGGMPGVYSARYASTDSDRISKLLKELETAADRSAQFICAIAICRPDGSIVQQVQGICPGVIAQTPQGQGGFGYDPIFYVPEQQMTFAQMSPELKRKISHRGKAFDLLLPQLSTLLNG
ncbi:RdgB/HAM1 family non-canonical purine NTP pyrophosphatase [Arthrospira platensis]|jgi:XTP/dITP diphosphohydrolase|uniref:dITP/XTP pyrophosphatase n=1 Tax=Limnospira platensis NIES-46 TaxID=1236695 RepID=A0A5M3T8N6_LIMPL|nr:RdgB/HAM1 family non-canonical purine NTP pyrophosphatase [Arthrospira platensis]KDR55557.1 nucleoside-triphosphate diphosphatase [Arthrospira platensis str. Paraca]MBD2670621.1 RdgB/HAM1 family non-canonical purine NTP pyrophosphatase [Arthrospira platensis FACHB-439]MBD2712807.1 RdgB/HAM1 family non-canonical purine NTP pyrophosphatase [Arthrospira platensis FACHB-835]MDF2212568.1 RdgB/HAM1 family non-canonical purine NTP pyrophosphatase [Arthrospira platensis NCB002]MDT9311572.1 RdgB/HAM